MRTISDTRGRQPSQQNPSLRRQEILSEKSLLTTQITLYCLARQLKASVQICHKKFSQPKTINFQIIVITLERIQYEVV